MQASQTQAPAGRVWPWPAILLAGYVLAVIARVPAILLDGRFWAEEGTLFFHRAISSSWPEALLYVAPKLGYYNLVGNGAALAASRLVSLEHAPLVTAWISLGVQTVPAIVIACGMIREIETLPARALALLVVLLLPPTGETWLNTVNGQSYLLLATALLLVADTGTGAGRIFRRTVLAVAGLSGLLSAFLLPLYWLRARRECTRERVVQACILTAAALVQGIVLAKVFATSQRQVALPPLMLAGAVFTKTLLLPLLGTARTARIGYPLMFLTAQRGLPAVVAVIVGLVACTAAWLVYRSRNRTARLLSMAGALVLVLSLSAAVERNDPGSLLLHLAPNGGERYYLVPNILFVLGLFVALRESGRFPAYARVAGALVLTWILIVSGIDYATSTETRAEMFNGPSWKLEVARWREQPSYRPHLWPGDWTLDLRRQ